MGIGSVSSKSKGLKLFLKFKKAFDTGKATIPQWVDLLIRAVDAIPPEAPSILVRKDVHECSDDDDVLPF